MSREYSTVNKNSVSRSQAFCGDTARLAGLMRRALNGGKLVLAFVGGSITQGCLSSTPQTCYTYLIYEWFVKHFPKAEFRYVNAGIGGTTTQFGVTRLEEDVFRFRPDFCSVEFSVNDACNAYFRESCEAVVRRLLSAQTAPAVMLINNLFYDNGLNSQEIHNEIGRAYGVPCISIRDGIYPELKAGRVTRPELSSDGLHPNDAGHAMVAGLVNAFLESVLEEVLREGGSGRTEDRDEAAEKKGTCGGASAAAELPAPVTVNALGKLRRVQNTDRRVKSAGFTADTHKKNGPTDIFSNGWTATEKGASITYTFTGSELALQYRRTVSRPAPVAYAILDGDTEHPFILDGNFDEDWGDCLYIDTLMYHGRRIDPDVLKCSKYKEIKQGRDELERLAGLEELASCRPERHRHTLTVTIAGTHKDDRTPFYLVSLIRG